MNRQSSDVALPGFSLTLNESPDSETAYEQLCDRIYAVASDCLVMTLNGQLLACFECHAESIEDEAKAARNLLSEAGVSLKPGFKRLGSDG